MTKDPLRIVHCVRSPIGGIFRHIKDLALSQAAAGHAVGLICDSASGSDFDNANVDSLRDKLSLGVERFPMRRQLSLQDMAATRDLYRHIKGLKPDVLHGHGAKGGAYTRFIGSLLRSQGQKIERIYCPHGGSLHYNPHSLEGRFYHALERVLLRMTDGIVFVSDYEYAAFETKVIEPTCATRVVYNGLQPSEFAPIEANPDAADFLYIGMLRDLKGPDLFIDALHNLHLHTGTVPTASIVGEGPDEPKYRKMVEDYGLSDKISFLGALPAREAFKLGKCVVVPSRAEAMPYIILETVAAERPLIATRVGGVPEVFGRYAKRLIEPGNVDHLTHAMKTALADPDALKDAAKLLRTCLADTFSVDLMADRITTLYRHSRGEVLQGDTANGQVQSSAQDPASETVYARTSNLS
ncbi:glycosyltransferase family 4 protein [Roseibium sp. CAU 1637]|uniref:Glycosyltransferase family 4 protein n=1 Tax=Roseibium limicola TaxID=2816037 RepID=A0A939J965_9HYPH|nr:glycosyltransferase family 4 protein [Roseibium limicola]MBO0346056.1 glycosyltransferase family 4 protein [Roseibium limicola]